VAIKQGYTEDGVIALGDDELLSEIYRWIGKAEDDNTSDALFWLVTEALESYAPEAEARQLERDHTTGAGEIRTSSRGLARRSTSGMARG
jgi:hypothetical protein